MDDHWNPSRESTTSNFEDLFRNPEKQSERQNNDDDDGMQWRDNIIKTRDIDKGNPKKTVSLGNWGARRESVCEAEKKQN